MNIEDDPYRKLLQEYLKSLKDSEKWLNRSYSQCQEIGIKKNYAVEEFDAFENLTSRFGRTVDFLINKVYRSIDRLEMENSGSLIDVVNRAHKRNLIDSVDEIRKLKELRNEIVHDYTSKELKEIFHAVFIKTPLVIELIKRTQEYCEKLMNMN